jgi:hypothetical protein
VDAGETLRTSNTSGTASENISLSLAAGVYFVRGYRFSGDTNYTLRLTDDQAGNTLGTARNVSALQGQRVYSSFSGAADTHDYYRVYLSPGGTLTASLSGLTADADLQVIRDADGDGVVDAGETLRTSNTSGTASENISLSLAAGVYFVRVYRFSGDTNYTLRLTDDRAGNTLGSARNFGTLSSTAYFGDFVGAADTNDYYRIVVPSGPTARTLRLTLSGLSADADLQLIRDANGNGVVDAGEVLRSSTAGGTSGESITWNFAAGTYFIRVYQHSGDTNYGLNVTV